MSLCMHHSCSSHVPHMFLCMSHTCSSACPTHVPHMSHTFSSACLIRPFAFPTHFLSHFPHLSPLHVPHVLSTCLHCSIYHFLLSSDHSLFIFLCPPLVMVIL